MLRYVSCAFAALMITMPANAEKISYLLCEYESLTGEKRQKIQSIPLYYQDDQLVAVGKRSHCVDETEFHITDTYATWRCVNALKADQTAAISIYVEINRFTGR